MPAAAARQRPSDAAEPDNPHTQAFRRPSGRLRPLPALHAVVYRVQLTQKQAMATSATSSSNMPGVTVTPRAGLAVDPVDVDAPLGDRAQLGQSRQNVGSEMIVAGDDADAPLESCDQCVSFEVLTSNLGNRKLEAGRLHGGVAVRNRERSFFVQGKALDSPAEPEFRTVDRPENRVGNPEMASGFGEICGLKIFQLGLTSAKQVRQSLPA